MWRGHRVVFGQTGSSVCQAALGTGVPSRPWQRRHRSGILQTSRRHQVGPRRAAGEGRDEAPVAACVRVALSANLLAGAAMVGVGVKTLLDSQHFLATAAAANGVVVGVVKVREENSEGTEETRVYPVVQFLTAREQVVRFQAGPGSNPPHHRIGGSIRVLYDPANPRHVRFDTWYNRLGEGIGLIGSGLGVVVVIAGGCLLARSQARKLRAWHRGAGQGRRPLSVRLLGGRHVRGDGRHVARTRPQPPRP